MASNKEELPAIGIAVAVVLCLLAMLIPAAVAAAVCS